MPFYLSKKVGDDVVCGCAGCSSSEALDAVFSDVIAGNDFACDNQGLKFTAYEIDLANVTGGPGAWSADPVGSWTADIYDGGCDMPPTGTVSGDFRLYVTCEDGVYSVLAIVNGRPIEFFNGAGTNPVDNQSGQGYFSGGICTLSDA